MRLGDMNHLARTSDGFRSDHRVDIPKSKRLNINKYTEFAIILSPRVLLVEQPSLGVRGCKLELFLVSTGRSADLFVDTKGRSDGEVNPPSGKMAQSMRVSLMLRLLNLSSNSSPGFSPISFV